MIIIYAINCYKDICTEIEVAEMRIEGLEEEKKELKKLLDGPGKIGCQQYSDMPKGSHNYTSLDRIIPTLRRIDSMLEIEQGLLKKMVERKIKMNEKLKGLQGFEYKVMYKKEIEGKSFEGIAEELNYSARQIRRVWGRLEKEVTQCQKI